MAASACRCMSTKSACGARRSSPKDRCMRWSTPSANEDSFDAEVVDRAGNRYLQSSRLQNGGASRRGGCRTVAAALRTRRCGLIDVYWLEQTGRGPACRRRLAERGPKRIAWTACAFRSAATTGGWGAGRRSARCPSTWTCRTIARSLARIEIRPAPSGAPEVFLGGRASTRHDIDQSPCGPRGLRRRGRSRSVPAARLRPRDRRAAQRRLRHGLLHRRGAGRCWRAQRRRIGGGSWPCFGARRRACSKRCAWGFGSIRGA